MNDEEFMNQKAKNMNVDELNKAIEIKSNDCDAINNHPELFEILKGKEWKELNDYYYHNIIILNQKWNYSPQDDKLFYCTLKGENKLSYKEIIRRK